MTWFTEGNKTNPTDATVLADTGALTPAIYEFTYILTASAATVFLIQHRNAANLASVAEFRIRVPAGETKTYSLGKKSIRTANERVRIITEGVIVGAAQAMIDNSI